MQQIVSVPQFSLLELRAVHAKTKRVAGDWLFGIRQLQRHKAKDTARFCFGGTNPQQQIARSLRDRGAGRFLRLASRYNSTSCS